MYGFKKIGSGSYGTIYNYKEKIIKQINLLDKNYNICHHSIKEICALSQLSHPNIIKASNIQFINNHINITMEKWGISLHEWCFITKKSERFKALNKIVFQIIYVLYYLYNMNIIHGDLKPGNILINPDTYEIKIIDWGTIGFINSEHNICSCTYVYTAPELIVYNNPNYNQKIDIFSLGLIIDFIYSKNITTDTEHFSRFYDFKYKQYPIFKNTKYLSFLDQKLIDLTFKMVKYSIYERIHIEDLFFNDFFDKYRPNLVIKKTIYNNIIYYKKDLHNYTTILTYRKYCIDWIFNILKKGKLLHIFVLAIWIMDKFIFNKNTISKRISLIQMQINVFACSIIAENLLNDSTYQTKLYFKSLEKFITYDEFIKYIWNIINTLNFNIYRKLFDILILEKQNEELSDDEIPTDLNYNIIKDIISDHNSLYLKESEKVNLYFAKIKQ